MTELKRRILKHSSLKFLDDESVPLIKKLKKCITYIRKFDFLNEYLDLTLCSDKFLINEKDENGITLLMSVCTFAPPLKTLNIVLKHEPDLNSKTDQGWTALMFACKTINSNPCAAEYFKLLVSKGANASITNKYGDTALSLIAKNISNFAEYSCAYILLLHGSNVNVKNINNKSALIYATLNSDSFYGLDLLRLFLICTDDVEEALIIACENNMIYAVNELIKIDNCYDIFRYACELYIQKQLDIHILHIMSKAMDNHMQVPIDILLELMNYANTRKCIKIDADLLRF